MQKASCILMMIIFLLLLGESSAKAQQGSFTIRNLLIAPVEVSFTFVSSQGKKVISLKPGDEFHIDWLDSMSGRRLSGFTVKEKNDQFPSVMTVAFNTKNEGVYAVGNISNITNKLFTFIYSTHSKYARVFGGYEYLTLNLTSNKLNGNFRKTCNILKSPSENEIHASCESKFYAMNNNIFIGMKALKQASKLADGLPLQFDNSELQCTIKQFRVCDLLMLTPEEKNKDLPPGNYLNNSSMAYFDRPHHILLAETYPDITVIFFDKLVTKLRNISYFSYLDLTGKTCKNISWNNEHQLVCSK